MAKVSTVYPEKWLKVEHLQGRSVRVVIEAASVERLYNPHTRQQEPRFVLAFQGKQLRLVLNKSQALAMVEATGSDESDEWVGCEILLKPEAAQKGGETIGIAALVPVAE